MTMKINFLINISVYRNGKINRWLQKKFNRKSHQSDLHYSFSPQPTENQQIR